MLWPLRPALRYPPPLQSPGVSASTALLAISRYRFRSHRAQRANRACCGRSWASSTSPLHYWRLAGTVSMGTETHRDQSQPTYAEGTSVLPCSSPRPPTTSTPPRISSHEAPTLLPPPLRLRRRPQRRHTDAAARRGPRHALHTRASYTRGIHECKMLHTRASYTRGFHGCRGAT
jgi:hypothetical protein